MASESSVAWELRSRPSNPLDPRRGGPPRPPEEELAAVKLAAVGRQR
uniref:Uncharacterized protein n=1 Tax=Arundo donax TaxID=35708 RepID=A0A0A8ZSJ0_ARUDO